MVFRTFPITAGGKCRFADDGADVSQNLSCLEG
jgi:hypothetical protein